MIDFEAWTQRLHGIMLGLAIGAILVGCSAPRSKEHRTIMEHQAEGIAVYREVDGVRYYVECEYGLKYLSSTASEERVGPVDTCDDEDE